jgi:hypothetical protein
MESQEWKRLFEKWRGIAVETVLRVLNAHVVYRVEMIESFQL